MAFLAAFSAEFLADLELIWLQRGASAVLPSEFTENLESAYVHALACSREQSLLSVTELEVLADRLTTWRNHHKTLLKEYRDRLHPDDPILSPVSLFGVLEYGRLETAHTRALAWLLGDGEHGFGFKLLAPLLHHMLQGRQVRVTRLTRMVSEFPVESMESQEDIGRIDVFGEGVWEEKGIEIPWVMAIEAKVDAEEGKDQLARYDDWLERYCRDVPETELLRVYLTPDGRAPETSSADWRVLTFADLAGVFRRVADLERLPGYHFLRYYLTGVLRDICGLPIPISLDCDNPFAANDYLKTVFDDSESVA